MSDRDRWQASKVRCLQAQRTDEIKTEKTMTYMVVVDTDDQRYPVTWMDQRERAYEFADLYAELFASQHESEYCKVVVLNPFMVPVKRVRFSKEGISIPIQRYLKIMKKHGAIIRNPNHIDCLKTDIVQIMRKLKKAGVKKRKKDKVIEIALFDDIFANDKKKHMQKVMLNHLKATN